MNQRFDMDKIPDNYSPMLLNISNDKPGTWTKRKGTALLGTSSTGGSTKVQGLVTYYRPDGTIQIRAIRNRNLDNYDTASQTWTTLSANEFAADVKVISVNYKGRLYHISTSDNLCYEDGSGATTDVGTAGQQIKGECLAVAQDTLYVGAVNYVGAASQNYLDRVYYSRFDAATALPTDELFNTGQTLTTSTRFFTLNEKCTALFRFGTAGGILHAFTANKCWSFDVNEERLRGVFDIGCANQRSITQCNGLLVWMDNEGRIWAWAGGDLPMQVSYEIEDDENGEALINSLTTTSIGEVCAGSIGNKFYFSAGDVSYRSETVTNAIIKGLFSQSSQATLLGVESRPEKPIIFSESVISSRKVLLYGDKASNNVFQMQSGINDGSTAITSVAKTKFFDFGKPFSTKQGSKLYIKYKPQSTVETYLTVRFAVEGNYSYTDLSVPTGTNPVTQYGVIDMYDAEAATKTDQVKVLLLPQDVKGRTISIEVSNDQVDRDFEVSGFGFDFDSIDLDIRPNI